MHRAPRFPDGDHRHDSEKVSVNHELRLMISVFPRMSRSWQFLIIDPSAGTTEMRGGASEKTACAYDRANPASVKVSRQCRREIPLTKASVLKRGAERGNDDTKEHNDVQVLNHGKLASGRASRCVVSILNLRDTVVPEKPMA